MTSPLYHGRMAARDAEIRAAYWQHLHDARSPLYSASEHERARAEFLQVLNDLIACAVAKRAELAPEALAEGDPPPALPERPAPRSVSGNPHA